MTELRFSLELYDEGAVKQAVEAFSEYGHVEVSMGDATALVQVTASSADDELELCGELGNYVLGATVDGAQQGDE